MRKTHIAYIELPCYDVPTAKRFYNAVFGWTYEDFGEDYAAFYEAGLDGGLNGGGDHRTKAPLVILETNNLEEMEQKVVEAGGTITLPIFAFPGGRRFHFTDPSGQELGVMQRS